MYMFDGFIHIKYRCILFQCIFYNLNVSPQSVSSPSHLFHSHPGQEQCGYPSANAVNCWYQSPQESVEVWIRDFDLMINEAEKSNKISEGCP